MRRYAVIPTRNRPLDLLSCLRAIGPQVDMVIVVNNNEGMPTEFWEAAHQTIGRPWHLIIEPEQPPNLSRLWNLGLETADRYSEGSFWEIAVLNDDAIVGEGWFAGLVEEMRGWGCAAASYGPVPAQKVFTEPGPTSLGPDERMAGYAFMLAGEVGLRADERLRWWCGDNDLDMQARQAGGRLLVPGPDRVEHRYPDQSTAADGRLQHQGGLDMATFVEKWGFRPW